MAQDKFYMAVEKQSYNYNRGFNSFIDLDDLDKDNYENFDKFHSFNNDKIPLYPYDHGFSNINSNTNTKEVSSYSLTSSSSVTSSLFKKSSEPTKNDIFDSPISLVRPAPRLNQKEIEEMQKQDRLREEKDQKEKVKAREEIQLKIDKEMKNDNSNMYLKWKTQDSDYNILFDGKNDKPIRHNDTLNNIDNSFGSDNVNNSYIPFSGKEESLLEASLEDFCTGNSFLLDLSSHSSKSESIIKSENSNNTLVNNDVYDGNDHHSTKITTIKNDTFNNNTFNLNKKLNPSQKELSKLQTKNVMANNNSPTSSPHSKVLSPEEQIARFLNMPFIASPNSSTTSQSQGKHQQSPSNASFNHVKSSEQLKRKSSFYGLSPSFSNSYQMDQKSLGKLQKIWNELYQKFVEAIPNINLSYLPTRKNLIGRGQYSNVYLGLYSVNDEENNENKYESEANINEEVDNTTTNTTKVANDDCIQADEENGDYHDFIEDSPLKQCAVKRFHKDYVSQMIAMNELNILTMLKDQPYIIQLIGLMNENEENKAFFHESCNSSINSGINTLDFENNTEPIRVISILEYASNGNIFSWIMKNPEYVNKKLWIKWARQITNAVATFHNMLIIHHDIKPQNILLDEYLNAKIADFGSSCYAPDEFPDRNDLTIENCQFPMEMGLGRGTQAYCAPELISNDEYYTFATDIYSLGVTLIAMMTGNEPFKMARNNIHMIMCIRKGFFGSGAHDQELRFLNGEMAEPKIVDLLKSCVDLDPKKRPTALKILETLQEIDDYVSLEEKL
ncbi:kinase-like protein [Piromyces finnis]|uniref:Kinase-like protein n=1 Tax=Piromyces finnis TaxID=1754191 RepID=A0A1Y1V2P0_9FUNG|nr:kinase-like protein [Piromyces finnis]|eukprot:ORX45957.1 kinase-like protein [Piromyces finnis]